MRFCASRWRERTVRRHRGWKIYSGRRDRARDGRQTSPRTAAVNDLERRGASNAVGRKDRRFEPVAGSAVVMVRGNIRMDRDIARGSILDSCRTLRAGRETRLDRNVMRSAFPPGPDGRALEMQLLELLAAANDGVFECRAVPVGDCVVLRRVRKALVPETQPPFAMSMSLR
jgi:hypothetical protein